MGKVKRKAMAWSYGLLVLSTITGIAGFVWNLYGAFWWFDLVQHGGFVFALTLTIALHIHSARQNNSSKPFLLLMTVGCGLGLGALWEVFELAYDQIAMANINSDFVDILADLIVDSVGGVAAGVVVLGLLDTSYQAREERPPAPTSTHRLLDNQGPQDDRVQER